MVGAQVNMTTCLFSKTFRLRKIKVDDAVRKMIQSPEQER